MFKKVLVISALTMGLLISAGPANAGPKEQPVNEQTDVVWVSGNAVALVDHVNNKADIVDLHTNTAITISEDSSRILDLQVMSSPRKLCCLNKARALKYRNPYSPLVDVSSAKRISRLKRQGIK